MDAVVVTNLTKSFGSGPAHRAALKNLSLRLPSGSMTALIGPDGAGKTTLLRTLAAILTPDAGEVRVLGYSPTEEALELQSHVGYMPQHFGLYEDLSVQENLTLFADLHEIPSSVRERRFADLLTMTALGPFRKRLAGKLSGGMKQKLGLACTLVHPPDLLLLDEASVGVDPISRREIWKIIRQQVTDRQITVLLSTAYMDEAERCDHVILLHEGEILAQGSPTQVSEPLQGRSFLLESPESTSRAPRDLQSEIAGLPGVIDAVIQADGLRIVTEQPQPPALPDDVVEHRTLKTVPARLEDAFVSLLFTRARRRPVSAPGSRASSDDTVVIEVRDLYRYFGSFAAVKGISFSVRKGEIFGLLGANGAGKSTTFRMLCGLLPSSSGTLRVAGVDLRTAPAAARARIGYVSQRFSLYATLSVKQNMDFFASAYGLRNRRRRERIAWALEEFELAPYAAMNAGSLPLGYKQRLALACALMHEPNIIFLDEPTSGVDPLARREFWARINALARKGTTCLVTTHFMEEAEYCDRLVLMSLGEVLAQGTPAGIKDSVRRPDEPRPGMEDAFISIIEEHERVSRRAS
ncbi:MAG: ATP-binding cassette domain-containing protein [Acidobacteriota bacterium]